MRAFIAIELPEKIKDALARAQEELKKTGADVKWVQPQNIHLTLKFLGERDDKKIAQAQAALQEAADNNKTFKASISETGAFPDLNHPRVIWAGVGKGDQEIKQIAAQLEEKIARIGIPKEERPFSSHITIGRVKSGLNKEKLAEGLKRAGEILTKEKLEFEVRQVTLYKSTLTPKGHVYEAVKEASLNAT